LFKYSLICNKYMCLCLQEAILSEHLNLVSTWLQKIFYCKIFHVKSKAVLLYAMKAHRGRGGIAPTHT
jgi:hypothetical protein